MKMKESILTVFSKIYNSFQKGSIRIDATVKMIRHKIFKPGESVNNIKHK